MRPFQGQVPLLLLSLHRRKEIPLEECVADVGSSEGEFLCVVGGCGQNSDLRQSKEEACYCNE